MDWLDITLCTSKMSDYSLQILITVALLLLVLVMVWYCWNLWPVPIQRWWSIGFGGASLAWAMAHWRADLWKKRYHELEGKLQSLPRQSQSRRLLLRRSISVVSESLRFSVLLPP